MRSNCILEFSGVRFVSRSQLVGGLSAADVKLHASELVLVTVHAHHSYSLPLFDLAEGLLVPEEGVISFMGRPWNDGEPYAESEMRARIGRVFDRQAWISNLSVYENIALASRHHTNQSEAEIRGRVEQLCRAAGLAAVPENRPDFVAKRDLQMAQWVRAFAANPDLLLMEHPEVGMDSGALSRLAAMVDVALERGAGVIWLTPEERAPGNAGLNRATRFSLREDGGMFVMEGEK